MKTDQPVRQVSPARRKLYHVGIGVAAAGLFLFLSTFVTFALNFGKFDNFAENARSDMVRAFGGMVLIMVGLGLVHVGRGGIAGSGLVLDPEQARRDLEPFARLSGGLTDAAFSEMHSVRQAISDVAGAGMDAPSEVVKVRCRACSALNDERDNYCGQCGGKLGA